MQKIVFFSFLAASFSPTNLPFARKIMVLPESGGMQPPALLARTPIDRLDLWIQMLAQALL